MSDMEQLRDDVVNQLENLLDLRKTSGNADQTERHIQSSKPDSISELELSFELKQGAEAESEHDPSTGTRSRWEQVESKVSAKGGKPPAAT